MGTLVEGGEHIPNKKYFTRIPNEYIKCNIQKTFGISRKFYIIHILIDRYRSLEDFSWLTISKVLSYYNYKTTTRKTKSFKEVITILKYMVSKNMIEIVQDLDSISIDTGIEIKIIPLKFDAVDRFTKFDFHTFDKIMNLDSFPNKEALLLTYLYISSCIVFRLRGESGEETLKNPSEKPEAFFKNINSMAEELSMSKKTITKCLNCLVEQQILKKYVVGSVQKEGKPPQNVPNIYVYNRDGWQQEIEWTLELMKKLYKVDNFDEIKGGNK